MYGNPFINNAAPDFYRPQTHQPPVYTGYSTPYPAPQLFQMPQPQPNFTIKRVSSIEEAKAAMLDPVGVYFFVDMGAGKIYMKQMKNDGTAEFYTFGVEETVEKPKAGAPSPLEEINRRLSNIESALGGIANVQSVSNDGSANVKPNEKFRSVNDEPGHAEHAGTRPPEVSEVQGNDFWEK